jgi:hypothetical protein
VALAVLEMTYYDPSKTVKSLACKTSIKPRSNYFDPEEVILCVRYRVYSIQERSAAWVPTLSTSSCTSGDE